MEGLLLGSVLQLSLALAAGASLSPTLLMEQTCGAVWTRVPVALGKVNQNTPQDISGELDGQNVKQ